MKRTRARLVGLFLLLTATLGGAGCYSPSIKGGQLHCGAQDKCPSAFHCALDGFCWPSGQDPNLRSPGRLTFTTASGGIAKGATHSVDLVVGQPGSAGRSAAPGSHTVTLGFGATAATRSK